jgi:hypothetical protein
MDDPTRTELPVLTQQQKPADLEDPTVVAATTPRLAKALEDDSPPVVMEQPHGGTAPTTTTSTTTRQNNGGTAAVAGIPIIHNVSWYGQCAALVRWKTLPVLSRKPVALTVLMLSSVLSVLLSYLAGPNVANVAPSTTCGPDPDFFKIPHALVNESYVDYYDNTTVYFPTVTGGFDYDNDAALSINDRWQQGFPIFCLSLGPLLTALTVYFIVHEEIKLELFQTIVRGLGVCDSAYWLSWFIPFATLAMINALFGAITAQLVPIHVCIYIIYIVVVALVDDSLFFKGTIIRNKALTIFGIIVCLPPSPHAGLPKCLFWRHFLLLVATPVAVNCVVTVGGGHHRQWPARCRALGHYIVAGLFGTFFGCVVVYRWMVVYGLERYRTGPQFQYPRSLLVPPVHDETSG